MSCTEPLATLSFLALSFIDAGLSTKHVGHLLALWPNGFCGEMAKWPSRGQENHSESPVSAENGQKDNMATTTYNYCNGRK